MNVILPSTGCNILSSSDTILNYSDDRHTRSQYSIYGGKLFLEDTSTSSYGYNVTGSCLNTGDLVYKPELAVYFPFLSMVLFVFTLWLIWRTIIRSLLP